MLAIAQIAFLLVYLFVPASTVFAAGSADTSAQDTVTTSTSTSSPTPTDSPSPSPTDSPAPTPTDSPTPSPTDSPSPTPTDSPAPSPTPTATPAPSYVPTGLEALTTTGTTYWTTQTVPVSGTGFQPDATVILAMVEPAGSLGQQWSVTTTSDGTFSTSALLLGGAGQYTVRAYGPDWTGDLTQLPLASTTLTAQTPSTVGLIVTFVAGTSSADQDAAIARDGGTQTMAIPVLNMRSIDTTSDVATTVVDAYASDPVVAHVEYDTARAAEATPNDTNYAFQWSLPKIGWDQAYGSIAPTGSSTVAILDTGVDVSHPDLAGQVVPGTSILDGSNGGTDPNGHGTWMAGIIAAATDNGQGVAGVGYAGVRVMPVTVLAADGTGQDSDIISGVVWASQHGANVILMAFSNPGYSPALQAAIDYAWSHGVVLVAATGNDSSTLPSYPAGDREVVGVSATDQNDALATFSNSGADTFLAAPGVAISTTDLGGGYTSIDGTSASAAEVAAAAALARAVDPSASNGVIVGRLAESADPAGTSDQTGNGRLNLDRALLDTSSTAVTPAGAPGGGPFVGPYVAAALHDGDGSMSVTPTTTAAGSTGNGFTFTFTAGAGGGNMNGGAVTVLVPAGWTAPQTANSTQPGYVTAPTGTCGVASRSVAGAGPWTITFTIGSGGSGCSTSQSFSFTYGGGGTKVTAPVAGAYTFTSKTKATSGGTLTAIATSPVITVSGLAPTTTQASSSLNPSMYGQSVTFTATVTSTAGTPTGTIQFKDGGTDLGSPVALTIGVATYATSSLTVAAHSLTAVYSGDSSFATSTSAVLSQGVTPAPLTITASSDTMVYGGTVPTITPSYLGFVAGDSAASLTTAPTCSTTATGTSPVGSYPSSCTGAVDANYTISYVAGSVSVTPASTTTTITSDIPDPSVASQSYTISWAVTVNDPGAGTPTGTVTAIDGDGHSCSAAVGAGSCSLTSTTAGSKTLTATYSGDPNFTGSSGAAGHLVNTRSTTTSLTCSPMVVSIGQTITCTVTVSDTEANGTASSPTGTASFTRDGASAGSCTLSSGGANSSSCSVSFQSSIATVDSIVASYGGSAVHAASASMPVLIVFYDANNGFVTGGGWITSPAGAYAANPSLTGRANFGFVSKYQKGATVPTGNTEFQFQVANLNFKSTSYDWLVISGSKAQYKGSGTISGAGSYKFMLTATDGSPDRFRIKIWDATTGAIVYDNQQGASDTSDPATAIAGGSIVIHK